MNDSTHHASDTAAQRQAALVAAAFDEVDLASPTAATPSATQRFGGSGGHTRLGPLQPDAIPGYRLLGEIHRGGQGVVFRAVQLTTDRTVAIKLLRDGPFATPAEYARFEREVRLLGQLRHPNIVAILHSDIIDGHHFYVMDFIDGPQLDQYLTVADLTVRETLQLFGQVCSAVAAAHLRGIIHRDLKPANIRIDRSGRPHVLDFGLSKLSTDGADDPGSMTLTGQFVGSMPWASPEQAAGEADSLDLRTDVYSLGVLLYQMLTDTFPYPLKGSPAEILRTIQDVEPTDPRRLRGGISDEVATIVLKCLQKDRERRYQSAVELGRDVDRLLRGEAIEAKRDSLVYMLRKQLVRHRLKAGIAAAFVLLLAVGLAVSLAFWRQAVAAGQAEAAARQVAQESAATATREAAKAEAVNQFLLDMLLAADPELSGNPDVPIREVLDGAAARLATGDLADQPLVAAEVHETLGMTYLRLGELDAGAEHIARCVALRNANLQAPHRDLISAMSSAAYLDRYRGDLAAAEEKYRAALAQLDALGGDQQRRRADILDNLGLTLRDAGRYDEARTYLEESLAIERDRLRPDDTNIATTLNNLALVLRETGDRDGAEQLFNEALLILRKNYGNQHVRVASVLESLAALRMDAGDLDAAIAQTEEALQIRRAVLGDDHPHVAMGMSNLAFVYQQAGKHAAAEQLYRDALALRRKTLGVDHPAVANTLNNLALLLQTTGRSAEAEPLYREALDIRTAKLGPTHLSTINLEANLALLLYSMERYEDSAALSRESLAHVAALPPDHWFHPRIKGNLGAALAKLDQTDEAARLLQEAYDGFVQVAGADHVRTRGVAKTAADLFDALGDTAQAAIWRARAADVTGNEVGDTTRP